MGVDSIGSGNGNSNVADAQRRAAEELAREDEARRAAAAPLASTPAPVSADVAAIQGQSSFDAAPTNLHRVAATREATAAVLDAGTQRLSAANAEVARVERELARQLAHLSSAMEPDALRAFAGSYRDENRATYDEAKDAANALARTLRDDAAAALQPTATVGHELYSANAALSMAVGEATQALDTYVRQSPEADPALSQTLADAARRAGSASAGLEAGGEVLRSVGDDWGRLAAGASHAFGIAGSAAGPLGAVMDVNDNARRLAAGRGRAEHVVGLGAGITELGMGALAIGGVAVSAPLALAVGAVGVGAAVVSESRDVAERRRAMDARLQTLGFEPEVASALANGSPRAFAALHSGGLSPSEVAQVAVRAPSLATDAGTAGLFSEARQVAGLTGSDTLGLLSDFGPRADDAAVQLAATFGQSRPESREALLQMLRPANPAFATEQGEALAAWLEAR